MSEAWETLFGRELWEQVGKDLRGMSAKWWEEYQDELVGYGRDELVEVLRLAHHEGTADAKHYIALRMDRTEFEAWRDGITDSLRDIAVRRARMFEALGDLGRRTARLIWRAVAAALGA